MNNAKTIRDDAADKMVALSKKLAVSKGSERIKLTAELTAAIAAFNASQRAIEN